MVRFKNRHLLVEFLQPSQLSPSFSAQASLPELEVLDDNDLDDDDVLPQIPIIPFLLPLPSVDGSEPRLKAGDEGGGAIFKTVRGIVQDVYGDEGWGRIASSFKGQKASLHSSIELTDSHLSFALDDLDDHTYSSTTLSPALVGAHPYHVGQRTVGRSAGGGR
jgi:ribonuclease P/MRP protein subunit POP5